MEFSLRIYQGRVVGRLYEGGERSEAYQSLHVIITGYGGREIIFDAPRTKLIEMAASLPISERNRWTTKACLKILQEQTEQLLPEVSAEGTEASESDLEAHKNLDIDNLDMVGVEKLAKELNLIFSTKTKTLAQRKYRLRQALKKAR